MTIQLLCLIFLYLPLSNLTSNETYIPNQTIHTVHHAASDYIFTSEMAIGFSLAVVLTLMPLQFYLCLVRKNPSPFA
jgi:heme/copper-type cytochrome/quinol oxidase subunit 4